MKLNRNQKSRLPQITGHRGAPSILLCVSVASVRNVPPRPRSFSIPCVISPMASRLRGSRFPLAQAGFSPLFPVIQHLAFAASVALHSAFRIQHWRRSALALQRQEGLTDDRF